MAEDAKTKEKRDFLDEASRCPQPGTKRKEKMEVRRAAGSSNRRDLRGDFNEEKDSEGWRKLGLLLGSEGKGDPPFISPGIHKKGWMQDQRPLSKLRKETFREFVFKL